MPLSSKTRVLHANLHGYSWLDDWQRVANACNAGAVLTTVVPVL